MSFFEETRVKIADSPAADAFGRWRVANMNILLSSQLNYADNALVWGELATGGGSTSHVPARAAMDLIVDGTDGAEVIRQTKRYYLYRAGQSHAIFMTFSQMTAIANVRKRCGYFDADNGLFFEVNGTTDVAVTKRSNTSGSPVDTRITQVNWNLDTLDGSADANNPSGLNLDVSQAQILFIDLQWLGAGRVRMCFDIAGVVRPVHEFLHANVLDTVYMSTATLPCRYEITNTAASAGATYTQHCSAVVREGGTEEEGFPTCLRSPASGGGVLDATTTPRSAISVRLRASHIRAFLKPLAAGLMNLGTGAVVFDVVLNPTLAAGPLSFANSGQLGLQVSFDQLDYTPGSGHAIGCGSAPGSGPSDTVGRVSGIDSVLGVAANLASTSDILSLIVEAAAGTQNLVGFMQMLELF